MEKYRLYTNGMVDIESILNDWFSNEMHKHIESFDKNGCKVTIFIADKYFLRINSTLTLTTIIERSPNNITAVVITSGGAEGLFGYTYGSEQSAAKPILKLLKENGFH